MFRWRSRDSVLFPPFTRVDLSPSREPCTHGSDPSEFVICTPPAVPSSAGDGIFSIHTALLGAGAAGGGT